MSYTVHPTAIVDEGAQIGEGSRVWHWVHVCGGARIGKGVVVCAYAQVRGEVPDFAIVAGQPARQVGDVRQRDAQLMEQLLAQFPELASHYQAWAGELPAPGAQEPT